jgi:uncharacterized protein (DUF433 family)
MATVALAHVRMDEGGVAWIEGTSTKVIEVVLAKRASGLNPEELQTELPHLSLAQIYAALAYYHAHRPEMDAEIEQRHRWAQGMRTREREPLSRRELQARLPPGG